jgi:hypothetical protein
LKEGLRDERKAQKQGHFTNIFIVFCNFTKEKRLKKMPLNKPTNKHMFLLLVPSSLFLK